MKKILKEFLIFAYLNVENFLFKTSFSKRPYLKNTVLIVKTDGVGDYLILEFVLKKVRIKNPNLNLHLVCDSSIASLAEESRIFDAIFSVNVKKFSRNPFVRRNFINAINSMAYEVVVCSMRSRNSLTADSVVAYSLSERKIGFQSDGSNDGRLVNYLTDSWYTDLMVVRDQREHELSTTISIFNSFLSSKIDVNMFSSLDGQKNGENKFCVVCPGSSWVGKNWPAENYVEIINKLLLLTSLHVCILGGSLEGQLIEQIRHNVSDHKRVFFYAGDLSLLMSIEMVKKSVLYVGNDTFLAHAAVLNRVPAIVIMGGGHYGRFFPYPERLSKNVHIAKFLMDCYGCKWRCHSINKHKPCVTNITTLEVLSIISCLTKVNPMWRE